MNSKQPSDSSSLPHRSGQIDVGVVQQYATYERVCDFYKTLLGRQPTDQEAMRICRAKSKRLAMLVQMFVVGFSSEARSRRGWLGRLVRCAEGSEGGPILVRKWLCRPMIQVLESLDHWRPGISGKPVGQHSPAEGLSDLHACQETCDSVSQNAPGGLTIIGYLSAETGLGEAARMLGQACVEQKVRVYGIDISGCHQMEQSPSSLDPPTDPRLSSVSLFYVNADRTSAARKFIRVAGFDESVYRIGFWHWEQTRFPSIYHQAFEELDEIWVPSTFVQDAIALVSPLPVFKVPHAIRFSPSKEATRERFGLPRDKQLALVMFNFYSCSYRKNPRSAIEAFRLASKQSASLGLVVKTQNGSSAPKEFSELQECMRDLPNAILIDESFSRQQTWDLESCCDILLSLHRAEGFGLGPAEMMYLGKPVVATGWSANMDFMNSDNSMPVRYELKPLEESISPYEPGLCWAEADIDHAAWCLVRLSQDPAFAAQISARAKESIRSLLAPSVIGQQVAERLALIAKWRKGAVGSKAMNI